ncbi:MAG: 23S rRNA pseudouridine(1911/1915/1917) synthase RluD [Chromatiales bacterium]|jgi:23S rRNA pseudouridine1911/1915/1917 synthase
MIDPQRILELSARIPPDMAGRRLDQALAILFGDFSRSRLQAWVREGRVTLGGRPCRARDRVAAGDEVRLAAVLDDRGACRPQAIPLRILFEDASILVVDKPAGLVVHPAAGNPDGTLQNALLHHDPSLAVLPRAGIVHRLDKDTSGLMVVARTTAAHKTLVHALQTRRVRREYRALVTGEITAGGTVDAPIGRHPVHRTRMAVVPAGKPAVTHYRVEERFRAHTWLQVILETGRTHQIRVHMAHIRHPLVGDRVYGRLRLPAGASASLREALLDFRRQALHAVKLGLEHPASGEWLEWSTPVPPDLERLLGVMRGDSRG